MNDERLLERLAAHAGPANVDPGFEDHLYAVLQREMRRTPRVPRAIVLLAAALLLALAIGATALVGSGLVKLPDLLGGSAARLAYAIDGDVYVADWDGTNPVRVADGVPPGRGCGDIGGAWSPDGRYLAYQPLCSETGTVTLSDPEGNPVMSFPGWGWHIAWSPDSTRLATWVEPYESIGIYGIDGVRQAVLTLPDEHPMRRDFDPVWSPDGMSVLLPLGDADGNGPFVFWELPINGDAPRRVPDDDPRSHPEFRYSPDGTQVAYVDDEGSLVVAEADGTRSRALISGQVIRFDSNDGPTWSPTGDRIAYNWTAARPVEDGLSNEIRVIDVTSGAVTTVARGKAQGFHVIGFSPESDRILFTRPEDDAIWSAEADGSGTQLLVSGVDWADWQPVQAGS